MRTKFFLVATFLVVLMSSCKDGDKNAQTDAAKPAVKQNFNVEMDIIADTQDDFTVYYTEDGTNAFVGAQAVWKGVNGGLKPEKVIIDLPEEVIPTNIRLDFGIKSDRKDVILEKLKINYFDKSFEIKGSDFLNYFIKNDLVITEVDTQKGTITFKKDPKSSVGTYFGPRQELLDQIAKMTK